MTAVPRTEDDTDERPDGASGRAGRDFLRWALPVQLGVTALVVVAIVAWVGHFTYTLDDAAIHLTVGERLARDGTWGVVPGQFQSASSSPLWTVLLAAGILVSGPVAEWLPLLLNVVAGVGVLWVLAQGQRVVRPGRGRPVDVIATVVLVVGVLFLPGLAVVGMEHTLHTALVLAAVLGVHRWVLDQPGPGPIGVAALVALATLTRFETAFVAVGLALALVAVDRRRWLGRAVLVLAASAVPIAAFGVVNRALGGGWLPNSLLAKGNSGGTSRDGMTPADIVGRAASDPLLLVLLAAALAYLVMRGRRGAAFVPAATVVTATAIHVALADVGWYERYQAYLIAIGVYAVLAFLAELPEAVARRALVALCVVAVVAAAPKLQLIAQAPLAADDMYRQQYQAGRFLERYYDGVPVATDQLGYISLFHDGPLTDFAGLGDWEVLERRGSGEPQAELWRDVAAERGVEVMVTYDVSAFGAPRDWILVGTWQIDNEPTTGVTRRLVFFATGPDRVAPLEAALLDFEDDMPARSELILNENADLQAMLRSAEAAEADGAPAAPAP